METRIMTPGEQLRDELGLKLPAQVAETFQVTVETLAQWRSNKTGPIPTRLGKSVYYHIHDLMEWSRPAPTYRLPTANESNRVEVRPVEYHPIPGSAADVPQGHD